MTDNYSRVGNRYHLLPKNEANILLRYIWLDGNGHDLRTKSMRSYREPQTVDEVPLCAYCGQTCGHMKLTANSDCWLKPVLLCDDPFRQHNHKLVFCVPIKYQIEASIYRHSCEAIERQLNASKRPLLVIRQPYILYSKKTGKPIGWPFGNFDAMDRTSNYGVGTNVANGRDINEAFYRACLYAGLTLSASQVEDMPSMWSFELGPTRGTGIADQLWMARYILQYISEEFDCIVSLNPLKHKQTDGQYLRVWAGDQISVQPQLYPMNSDPYLAVKTICQSLLGGN
ncbi:unnamed protein product [Oppiella nova]|uniref:Uncharacterized protein n=1 Tax=Oppiella nova TaxID=334625 RepID=A0A7R9QHX2_9ACAR|nr:unnamed protein product [Oppiella nova]CAG2166296.1 unnamed protein product [Oppiella nova]